MHDAPIPGARIRVEVVYADYKTQIIREVELPVGAMVEQAIQASQILDLLPADFSAPKLGIFGRIVSAAQVLREGDRVELYRPLKIDPKEARRARARRK